MAHQDCGPQGHPVARGRERQARLYLDLIKRKLTRYGFDSGYKRFEQRSDFRGRFVHLVNEILRTRRLEIVRTVQFDPQKRLFGTDWPAEAETMIGWHRLSNLEYAIRTIINEGVAGDFLEAGIWRGGACIFMVAALEVMGDEDRVVWMADSFQGLPYPTAGFTVDMEGVPFWERRELVVGEQEVISNFSKYGLWNPARIRTLKGWFKDTLPRAPVERLSLLRLDGDLYESTWIALESLYSKLSRGGFCIIDDFGSVPGAQNAVRDFRAQKGIEEELTWVDRDCVY